MVRPQRSGYVGVGGLLEVSTPAWGHSAVLSLAMVLVKLTCPTSTSAGLPFCVGIEFQINTRLYPRSATKTCRPSLVTETGLSMVPWVAVRTGVVVIPPGQVGQLTMEVTGTGATEVK